ncbi:unnamed protein product [Cuscuta campestris]|uniref:Reverse transcriptase domain-containing protein n=1 Tax=Cuscuta campestris TaxID=132261 RepID=A0A484K994_9ASTE|nr:unnamed protein product [Cuscuta campestris]
MMDILTLGVQGEVPWCMLFADDIVLIDDTRDGLNNKTEYMECRFSGQELESMVEVRIDSHLVPKVDKFRGSVIQADVELDVDVAHCGGAAWAKWRWTSGFCAIRRFRVR